MPKHGNRWLDCRSRACFWGIPSSQRSPSLRAQRTIRGEDAREWASVRLQTIVYSLLHRKRHGRTPHFCRESLRISADTRCTLVTGGSCAKSSTFAQSEKSVQNQFVQRALMASFGRVRCKMSKHSE